MASLLWNQSVLLISLHGLLRGSTDHGSIRGAAALCRGVRRPGRRGLKDHHHRDVPSAAGVEPMCFGVLELPTVPQSWQCLIGVADVGGTEFIGIKPEDFHDPCLLLTVG